MKKLIILAVVTGSLTYFGSKMLLHHKVESGIEAVFLAISPYVNVEYSGVSSTMTGQLTIDGIRAQIPGFDDEIYIERLGIDTPSFFTLLKLADIAENMQTPDDVMPEYFGVIAQGVHMRVNADYMRTAHLERLKEVNASDDQEPAAQCAGKYGFSPSTLSGLGYSEQVVSLSARFRRGSGDYFVDITSGIENMWNLDAELTLEGDLATEMSKGLRYRPRMSAMRVKFEDQSLNGRIRKYCGQLGLSAADTLLAQLDALRYFGKENGVEFDEYVIDPYIEFLQGKTTLVVTAKPTEPVSLSQIKLYKPSDVPALLKLSAEAF